MIGIQRCRLAMLGMFVIVVLITACCGNAPPQHDLTVSEVQQKTFFYQGRYLGTVVTVDAVVSRVQTSRSFILSDEGTQVPMLPVVATEPVNVAPGELVRVTGTVGQLHFSAPSEGAPYIQTGLYAKSGTESYLYHAVVQPVAVR